MHFKVCDTNYNAYLNIYPSWVVEAANELARSKGFDPALLAAAPQHRIPVHDALHYYTGIEVTLEGECCIQALEEILIYGRTQLFEYAEEALNCWERVDENKQEFFREFYLDEDNYLEIDADFQDYFEEYMCFLRQEAPDIFNRLVHTP